MAATTADLVRQFVELDQQRKAKEGEVDKLKEQLAVIETELLQRFEHAGLQSMKTELGVTVYVHRQLWAGAQDGNTDRLVGSLKLVGLEALVREQVNSQTLSAWVREQAKAHENGHTLSPEEIRPLLPGPLQEAMSLSEKFSVRTRKG